MSSNTFSRRRNFFLLLLIGGGINGVLNTLVIVTTTLANGEKTDFFHPLLWEATGTYSFTILIPFMIYLFKKYPLKKNNLISRIPVYIFVTFLLGAVHTAVMYLSRIFFYHLLDWGNYYYGYLPYRYVMETLKLSVGFWSVFVVFILVKTNKERELEKLRTLQLEEQLTKTRLDFLKSQINPHFLFNTLNMISSIMYENVEDADKMIANLSDLLRISLKSSNGLHTLKEELNILKLYLEIMKARYRDKLTTKFIIDEDIYEEPVPPFFLQPIVENSIKHGMENLSSTEIIVTGKRNGQSLSITIEDNGPGIHESAKEVLNKGVGLSNTQERLEWIYGNNFEFFWQNLEKGGLIVKFTIPTNGKLM